MHQNHTENRTEPSVDEVASALKSVISQQVDVYVIIDALDECSRENHTQATFLEILLGLCRDTDSVHLLLTSRDTPDIIQKLKQAPRLEVKAQESDVRQYIQSQFVHYKAPLNDEWRANVEDIVARRTNGM